MLKVVLKVKEVCTFVHVSVSLISIDFLLVSERGGVTFGCGGDMSHGFQKSTILSKKNDIN